MKHWKKDQVLYADISEGQSTCPQGYPAAEGGRFNAAGDMKGWYELEIIPDSDRIDVILDPSTFKNRKTRIVDVIFRKKGVSDSDWTSVEVHAIPLDLFGLQQIPNNPDADFNRAMSII